MDNSTSPRKRGKESSFKQGIDHIKNKKPFSDLKGLFSKMRRNSNFKPMNFQDQELASLSPSN